MLVAITLLLSCQLAGELMARGAGLPIPGPVIGLALMVALFALRPSLVAALRPTATVIVANLSLLFVPAGVGVVTNLAHPDRGLGRDPRGADPVDVLSMLAAVGTFLAARNLLGRSDA